MRVGMITVLMLMGLLAGQACAFEVELPTVFQNDKDQGDRYFQDADYGKAFKLYQQACRYGGDDPSIHYRLARIYGFLAPQQNYAEREFALALNLYLKTYQNLSQVNIENLRLVLGIPIDPATKPYPGTLNPVYFLKRDVDKDGKDEAFLIFRRGNLSYAVFVIDFLDLYPRVSHLVSFYEGLAGRADLEFRDIDADGKDEVVVSAQTKEHFNALIFKKDRLGQYRKVFSQIGLLHGKVLFVDIQGDRAKEIEVKENIEASSVFDVRHSLLLTQRSVYFWNKGEYHREVCEIEKDEIYALNQFFSALLLNGDFKTAYQFINPEIFFRSLNREDFLEEFKDYMHQKDFKRFLVSEPESHKVVGNVIVMEDVRYSEDRGWQEGSRDHQNLFQAQSTEKHLRVFVGEDSYSLEMRKSPEWKIVAFKKDPVQKGGWSESV